jgi:hypothetical protein
VPSRRRRIERGDAALHRRVDGRAVARGQQVEQQPAGGGDAEAGLGAGLGLRAPVGDRRAP